ncbi:MAG: nuclease-related domain-containing protein [bacterium]
MQEAKKRTGKKSPIKKAPLRLPGQFLDEKIKDIKYDMLWNVFVCLMYLTSLVIAWLFYLFPKTFLLPLLLLLTLVSVLVFIFYGTRISKQWKEIDNHKLGRVGEIEVGQTLEKLREQGCRIFHDIQMGNYNIDHVVLSTKGVFVIETKTRRKPAEGRTEIVYEGDLIRINGSPNKTDIEQAKSQACGFHKFFKLITGNSYFVRPVIVYPGWYVTSSFDPEKSDMWVLNPDQLSQKIAAQPEVIKPKELETIANQLEYHIREKSDLK